MELNFEGGTELDNTNSNSPKSLLSPRSSGNDDRRRSMKRDEWNEEAVSCLLEAYEARWALRNRAKLRGGDWHDVAKCVSAKTHTQCKNKIESFKKRYRSELAAGEASSWPLYRRIDRLLRGNALPAPPPQPLPASQPAVNSHSSSSVGRLPKGDGMKLWEQEVLKSKSGEDSSKDEVKENRWNRKTKMERRMMKWVAEVMVRNQEARMETMREIEIIRMNTEEKRIEIELKRIQIMTNAQIQIAKLFATA